MNDSPHRDLWIVGALLAALTLCCTAPARSEEPERETRPTLPVPEELAKLGDLYRVVATKAPQIRFSSKTNIEKFDGTSKQLDGFVVVPTNAEALPVEFAAAEFRLPVVSLVTESESRTEHIHGKAWLNAPSFPEIVFAITGVSRAKLARERDGKSTYKATLDGTMTIMGISKELSVPTTIIMKPENAKTRRTAPGDLLTIKGKFAVALADFGIENRAIQKGQVAEKIKINTNLTLSKHGPRE